ncbi:hypothetical protein NPIL_263881, partial [Nephila pilipes]
GSTSRSVACAKWRFCCTTDPDENHESDSKVQKQLLIEH